eukprot:TRINITY_DN3592_c0_g1_i2.p1 TRINITY_DN3592_c0_g1~~TRINITY_DN3592_c0_g1_i2.p1  ORF type:complete len:193 (-),score=29.45 TRINITY_DN3592_c0_g1_i2:679-1257(-)
MVNSTIPFVKMGYYCMTFALELHCRIILFRVCGGNDFLDEVLWKDAIPNRSFLSCFWCSRDFDQEFSHAFQNWANLAFWTYIIVVPIYCCDNLHISRFNRVSAIQLLPAIGRILHDVQVSSAKCYDQDWNSLTIFILLYCFGIPLALVFVFMKYKNHLDSKNFRMKFGYPVSPFSQRFFYWELVVMLKELFS